MISYRVKKKTQTKQAFLFLIPICLFLSNFAIISFAGKKLRPLEIVVPLVAVFFLSKLKRIKISATFGLMVGLPLFGLINAISKTNWLFSYAFYFLEVFVLYSILGNTGKILDETKFKIVDFVFVTFVICTVYGVIQFVLANVFGSMVLYNCFGWFQYHPHYSNTLRGIIRATSIFYEPSVFGWMAVFVFALNQFMEIKKRQKVVNVCVFISLIISFSSSAILGFVLVWGISILLKRPSFSKAFLILSGIFALLLILIIGNEIFVILRLTSISSEGSSGYNRIVYPFDAMIQTIKNYPLFGRGLGQIGEYDSAIENYGEIYNSLFGIVVVFGLSAIFMYSQIFWLFNYWIKKSKKAWVLVVLMLFLLFSNGSFLTLEFPVIAIICTFAIECKKVCVKEQKDSLLVKESNNERRISKYHRSGI